MKIVFLIERKNFYRSFGEIIQYGLDKNLTIECWHNVDQKSDKSHLLHNPSADYLPEFKNGVPIVRTYSGNEGIDLLVEEHTPDVIFSFYSRKKYLKKISKVNLLWCIAIFNADFIALNPIDHYLDADVFFVQGSGWLKAFENCYQKIKIEKIMNWENDYSDSWHSYYEKILSKVCCVGSPIIDCIVNRTSKDEIKRKLKIPSNKKVLLFLPFQNEENYKEPLIDKYEREAFFSGRKFPSIIFFLKKGKLSSATKILLRPSYGQVAKAIRIFCDLNDCFLLVKPKNNIPQPECLTNVADYLLNDDSFYPPSICSAIAVADICIHGLSMGGVEALGNKVPSIGIIPYPSSQFAAGIRNLGGFTTYFEYLGLNLFVSPLCQVFSASSFVKKVSNKKLSDFKFDEKYFLKYEQNYLHQADGQTCKRIYAKISELLNQKNLE